MIWDRTSEPKYPGIAGSSQLLRDHAPCKSCPMSTGARVLVPTILGTEHLPKSAGSSQRLLGPDTCPKSAVMRALFKVSQQLKYSKKYSFYFLLKRPKDEFFAELFLVPSAHLGRGWAKSKKNNTSHYFRGGGGSEGSEGAREGGLRREGGREAREGGRERREGGRGEKGGERREGGREGREGGRGEERREGGRKEALGILENFGPVRKEALGILEIWRAEGGRSSEGGK